jgi:nucleoside-diphosphate-sugar epimerase
MTVVAHAEDLATMLTAAVGNAAANGQIFNAVTDRAISLDGMARLCAKVAGKEAQIVHYDPKKVEGVDVKKAFPFRPVHFYAEPRAAKRLLGWTPKWTLEAALKERWDFFQASGRGKKDKAFADDDLILAAVKK